MQNFILNTPSRVANVAGRTNASPEQSGNAVKNNAFEQVLNKQVNARQQKMGRTTPEPMQQTKTKAPKLDDKPDVSGQKQTEDTQIRIAKENAEKATSAQMIELPNSVEIMWANVMTANQLAKTASDAKGESSGKELASTKDQLTIDLNSSAVPLDLAKPSTGNQNLANLDGVGESLMKLDAAKSQLLPQTATKEDLPIIPDDKLPTEQVRWLDLPINRPTDSAKNVSAGEIQLTDTKSAALISTDLQLAEKASEKTLQQAIETADMQASITPAATQNQTASAANPSALSESKAAGSGNHIQAYLGQSEWHQAINQKVMWMIGASEQTAVLTLNPPDLGPIQVVISVNNDQADATFTSANPDVRQALQDGLSNLRDKLNESGLQLGQANINANLNGGSQHSSMFSNGQPQSQSQASQSLLKDANLQAQTITDGIERKVAGKGLVDTFV